jgi:hypothetical protein
MKSGILYLIYFLALISQPVHAVKVSGLYQATISVSDESVSKRRIALKQALGKVLVKVTGDRNIKKSMSASLLFERSERFVQQYRYHQATNKWGQKTATSELWVQFDKNTLNEALKTYGVTIWGKERPSILVWIVCQKDENRFFVNLEECSEYLNILENRAAARGVRLLFPLLDLQDNSQISVTDVWGGFTDQIKKASKRYQSNAVLTGKFIQILPTLWQSKWSVYFDEQMINWTSQSDIADIVLEEGIDELVDKLVSYYANTGEKITEVIELLVNDIDSLDKYAQTFSYLKSLQSVFIVNVKRVSSTYVVFELTSDRGSDGIYQEIALEKILGSVEGGDRIEYRLLP